MKSYRLVETNFTATQNTYLFSKQICCGQLTSLEDSSPRNDAIETCVGDWMYLFIREYAEVKISLPSSMKEKTYQSQNQRVSQLAAKQRRVCDLPEHRIGRISGNIFAVLQML
ncbi:hypothetical protein Tsp_11900 [Trichinella spiralis]|uniref:Uncharacterized protein n=1 Tax=Trichinella spiralis TaxID=6334 RepID=E5STR1_TRISP|nr:hypothetical protein Tsp_11900 [Trichinella spiralis]KRY39659.1 hypothetical protein T01_4620 [Trichinella spiralis]